MNNGVKVLKNTLYLYLRMIILTIVSLGTVKIVLQALGAEDYGLYNVVVGIVSMFAFLSGTLTIASQRYFAIYLATNDWKQLNKLYSINFIIYLFVSLIVIVLSQTVGLWFVLNKLVIPEGRINACIIAYELSVISFIIGLLVCPYLGLLVADENLSIYSKISVVEGLLKVVAAYCVYKLSWDKLIIYSILNIGVNILINGFYVIYSLVVYKKLKFVFCREVSLYKDVLSFLNWNLIGAIAAVGKGQGINIIMNTFFGGVINAARGIASQVSFIIASFSLNFMKAVDPQIIKTFATDDNKKKIDIICISSKISFYLLYIIGLPLAMNIEYILKLWLINVPQFTMELTVLALIDALLLSVTDPICTAVQAIGKVKWYQITVGGLALFNLPIAYIILRYVHHPVIPSMVCIIISFFINIIRVINIKFLCKFSILVYIKDVILPLVVIVFCS
ncbi:lipopolysaccharide biosynthesis protein, partial [Treponema pedis]|uniref:lipopolysaccharide biosynthesis protein n=1 Tax=Treponema pedis TaxID=409322 RepID=UPI00046784BA